MERIDRLRKAIDDFNQRGLLDFEAFDPAVEWRTPADLPDAGVRRGREEVRDHLYSWAGAFEEFRADPQEFIEVGDCVIVRLVLSGRLQGSGIRVQQPELVDVFRFRGDTVVEVREYRTTQEALRAAAARAPDARYQRS